MVDFTRAQIPGQVASPTNVGAPERGPSALASLAGLAQSFIPSKQQLDAVATRKAEAKSASVTELYSQEALRLADAVDLGEMSSGVARARMRRLYSTYISNNPGLQKDLYDVHNRIVSTSGLGQVIDEGTEEERREREYRDKVADAGFIVQGMSEEEQQQATDDYRSFETSKYLLEIETQKLAFANAELENISKKIGIDTARINQQRARTGLGNDQLDRKSKLLGLEMRQHEYGAMMAMTQMSQSAAPMFQRNVGQVLEGLGPSPTPEQRAAAKEQINTIWGQTYGGVMAGLGPGASTSQVEMIIKPMKDWMDYAVGVADGTQELTGLQTATDLAVQQQAFQLSGDPEVAAAAGFLSVMGEITSLGPEFTAIGVRAFKRSMEGNPPPPTSTEYPEFLELSMSVLNGAAKGNLKPASVEEAQLNLNSLLGGIGSLRNPAAADLDVAAENLSSAQFGAYVDKFGLAGFDGEARQGAATVFDEFYVREVVPLIREEWHKATYTDSVGGPTPSAFRGSRVERPVPENMQVDFSGSGVRFQAAGVDGARTSGLAASASHRLNTEVAPVLNKLVKLGAHLEGHTNYRQFFEQNYKGMFGTEVIREEGNEG